jgi:asparagine synthase (glutamine-hydrolysing)
MNVKLPYLDPEFKSFAMEIEPQYKVRSEKGQIWGKWILRKSFENILPKEIVWRAKTPIEYGSGTTMLPNLFDQKISDQKFEGKQRKYLEKDKVTIRDKEQLFYYEIFRRVIGVPHPYNPQGRTCPQCNSNVPKAASYCRTCGAYPIR